MWFTKVDRYGCCICGSSQFRERVVEALHCLAESETAVKYMGSLAERIFQKGCYSFCRIPDRFDLVISAKCTGARLEALSAFVLFGSILNRVSACGSNEIVAVIEALEAQINFAKEMDLDIEYVQNLEANLQVFHLGCIPGAMLRHPAF